MPVYMHACICVRVCMRMMFADKSVPRSDMVLARQRAKSSKNIVMSLPPYLVARADMALSPRVMPAMFTAGCQYDRETSGRRKWI